MDAVLQRVNNLLTDLMNNTTFTVVASLVLAMYAGLAAPSLPNSVVLFFDTTLGKLLFIFLIAFVASKNVQVAIMVAVAFLVTLNVLQTRNAEGFNNYIENFIDLEKDTNENFIDLEKDNNENFAANKKTKAHKKMHSDDSVDMDEDITEETYMDDGEGDMGEGDMGEGDMGEGDMGEGDMGEGDMGENNMDGGDEKPADNLDLGFDEGDMNEGSMNEGDMDVENFTGEYNVKPAFNLNGNSSNMFAPVSF